MSKDIHKALHSLKNDLDKKKLTRREFIRYANSEKHKHQRAYSHFSGTII
jgi:hypothetical protein